MANLKAFTIVKSLSQQQNSRCGGQIPESTALYADLVALRLWRPTGAPWILNPHHICYLSTAFGPKKVSSSGSRELLLFLEHNGPRTQIGTRRRRFLRRARPGFARGSRALPLLWLWLLASGSAGRKYTCLNDRGAGAHDPRYGGAGAACCGGPGFKFREYKASSSQVLPAAKVAWVVVVFFRWRCIMHVLNAGRSLGRVWGNGSCGGDMLQVHVRLPALLLGTNSPLLYAHSISMSFCRAGRWFCVLGKPKSLCAGVSCWRRRATLSPHGSTPPSSLHNRHSCNRLCRERCDESFS